MNNNFDANKPETENSTMSEQTHKISPVTLCCSILAILLFAAACFYAGKISALHPAKPVTSSEKTLKPSVPAPAKPAYKLEDFKRKIEAARSKHNAANRQLWEDFKREIQAAGEADFSRARNNIGETVGQFCNFKACANLVYTMARDKIKGTQEAQNMITSVVSNRIMQPCAAGGAAIQDATANFIHRLKENDNIFRAECAAELKNFPEQSSDLAAAEDFVKDLTMFNQQVENYVMTSAFTAVGTVIEAALLPQTIAAFGRLLGPVVVKVTGSAAAPFLDGPLPIGDIIAIGGFIWCNYDIYQVLKVLPQKMRTSLLEAIANYSSKVRAEALKKAEKRWNSASIPLKMQLINFNLQRKKSL